VAAALAGKFAVGVAFFGGGWAHVVENFAAWAARARVTHGPEIVFEAGNRNDAVGRNILREPELLRFFVDAKLFARSDFRSAKNRGVELILRNREPFRRSEKFPGVGYGVLLEIIAKGKIAEHFKKSVMAFGEADVFEVVVLAAGADAFLRRSRSVVAALFKAEENILELVHSGVGEEQRGIAVRNKRA